MIIETKRDELLAGQEVTPLLWNVKAVGTIERGELLAGGASNIFSAAGASDASKPLVISAEDAAGEETYILSVYTRGRFNAERIKLAEGVDIEDFMEPLRKSGIHVTSLKGAEQ